MKVHDSVPGVRDRLAALDLTPDELREICLQGYGLWADHTEFDPPSIANTNLWGRATRVLREKTVMRGWRWDNKDQQPRTVHSSGRWAVVVSTGDDQTGLRHGHPSTKNPKGDATARKVASNQAQLDFPDLPADSGSQEQCISWFLLIYVDEDEIRAELSLPDEINASGFVKSWAERIILSSVSRGGDAAALADDGEEPQQFEVAVERR